MNLGELKQCIEAIEERLADEPFVLLWQDERIKVVITERLRKKARKGRVWKSKPFLTALKNATYGVDQTRLRSRGGSDGVFLIDRSFEPVNPMMVKIFDGFLDKQGEADSIAAALHIAVADLIPVRVVSHHMRLLGVMASRDPPWLVLVDYDASKP